MKALIVEGGAMRGIFSAGVLKAFADHNYNPFELYIGISAGACNLASYLAGNQERNLMGYTKLMSQQRFINWVRFLKGGNLLDLDWLWERLNEDYPINEKIFDKKENFRIVVTNVDSGKAEYKIPTSKNIHAWLLASSSIPIAYKPFIEVESQTYTDGGVSDPLPIEYAIQEGATDILILRSRPIDYISSFKRTNHFWRWILRKYPALGEAIINQHLNYNNRLHLARNPPKDINIQQILPNKKMNTTRLSQNISWLENDYQLGYYAALNFFKDNK